jgi:prolyl oligopeptidase
MDGMSYPAVLFPTGSNDPRVDPMHSRKMTARLQAATRSGLPVLLRAEAGTGHVGTPLKAVNELAADIDAFLFDQLKVAFREPATRPRATTP